MKGYVLSRVDYQYNDEVYSQGEGDGVNPEKIFMDKETALKECEKLNVKMFRGLNIHSYTYDIEDLAEGFTKEEIKERLKGIIETDGEYDWTVKKDASYAH